MISQYKHKDEFGRTLNAEFGNFNASIEGALYSISNIFDRIEELESKIKDLESKLGKDG